MSSFLKTQLSASQIKELHIGTGYEKYDLIDFQYNTGNIFYPNQLSGLYAWFSADDITNFQTDNAGNVSEWISLVEGFESLVQNDVDNQPLYSFKDKSITFGDNSKISYLSSLDFEGLSHFDKCYFFVFEIESLKTSAADSFFSTIFDADVGSENPSSGYLGISGDGDLARLVLKKSSEDNGFDAIYPIRNLFKKNILSILKNNTTNNLTIRNNGVEILNTGTAMYFHTGISGLSIGATENSSAENLDNAHITFNEILAFAVYPSEEQISGVEKFLFKKHFGNEMGIYIASQDFTASSNSYSPITESGSALFSKSLNDLFHKTYGSAASFETKAYKITYGDGYYLNTISNLNNLTANFSLNFQGLTDKQSNCLAGFFQSTFENTPEDIFSPYKAVDDSLFFPYRSDAKIYFNDLKHNSTYKNINSVTIECQALYSSNLDYRGMFVVDYVKNFAIDGSYQKHDIIYYHQSSNLSENGYYWYNGTNTELAPLNQNIASPAQNGSPFVRSFYFKPDLSYSIELKPRKKINSTESSSEAFESDGINKNVLELNLPFSNRSDAEALAILKFLDDKAGFKVFEFNLPPPYNRTINVYCPTWQHSYNFKDNHTIEATFFEFKGFEGASSRNLGADIYFNTIITL